MFERLLVMVNAERGETEGAISIRDVRRLDADDEVERVEVGMEQWECWERDEAWPASVAGACVR